jgi:hypothetical protein
MIFSKIIIFSDMTDQITVETNDGDHFVMDGMITGKIYKYKFYAKFNKNSTAFFNIYFIHNDIEYIQQINICCKKYRHKLCYSQNSKNIDFMFYEI